MCDSVALDSRQNLFYSSQHSNQWVHPTCFKKTRTACSGFKSVPPRYVRASYDAARWWSHRDSTCIDSVCGPSQLLDPLLLGLQSVAGPPAVSSIVSKHMLVAVSSIPGTGAVREETYLVARLHHSSTVWCLNYAQQHASGALNQQMAHQL